MTIYDMLKDELPKEMQVDNQEKFDYEWGKTFGYNQCLSVITELLKRAVVDEKKLESIIAGENWDEKENTIDWCVDWGEDSCAKAIAKANIIKVNK